MNVEHPTRQRDDIEANVNPRRLTPTEQTATFTVTSSPDNASGAEAFYRDGADSALAQSPLSSQPGRSNWLWLLGVITLGCACFSVGALATKRSPQPPPVGPFISTEAPATPPLMVHVAGQVKHPGVYRLPDNARVLDAIRKAGGPLPPADLDAINLAAWAEDGSRIVVPAKTIVIPQATEVVSVASEAITRDASTRPTVERTARPAATGVPGHVAVRAVPTATAASPSNVPRQPINLNRAGAAQLESLPGVGPALARRIIEYRAQNGGFRTVDDLDDVKGIGEKKLEKLRPFVIAQ